MVHNGKNVELVITIACGFLKNGFLSRGVTIDRIKNGSSMSC